MKGDTESAVKLWRNKGDVARFLYIFSIAAPFLGGCQTGVFESLPGMAIPNGPGGIVVADEPQAVVAAGAILDSGGNAADAAVTLALTLSVTFQSSAGVGGGGLCVVHDVETAKTEVLDFTPQPAVSRATNARWQASVPSLPRGLFALHSKYGKLPWQSLVIPAENLARFGTPVTRAFARDLAVASSALVNDPQALDTYSTPQRTLLQEGDQFTQLELAALLGRIRARTPGDFYTGAISKLIDEDALEAGVSIGAEDLRTYSPRWTEAETIKEDGVTLHLGFHNTDGSRFKMNVNSIETPELESSKSVAPSSTGFVVADSHGNAVACALTMIEPFGAGLLLDRTGFLVAPNSATSAGTKPRLVSVVAVDQSSNDVTFVSATGGAGGLSRMRAVLVDILLNEASSSANTNSVGLSFPSKASRERTAQVNALYCKNGLRGSLKQCSAVSDPRGLGYGLITYGED